jgi:type III secretion protein C
LLGVGTNAVRAQPNAALPPLWTHEPLPLVVIDQELREVLTEIGQRTGVRVTVSDAVRGRVRGRLPALPPQQLIDLLARTHGFDWFFDGAVLHVSSMGEATSRILVLGSVPPEALEATLAALGLADARWPARLAGGLAYVSGPPRYVAMIEQVLGAIARRPGLAAEPASLGPGDVRIFRGRAAVAG